MRKYEKGVVYFLPLVLVAVLLIGVVGYFSVSKIKSEKVTSVLSKSDENEGSSGSSGGSGSSNSGSGSSSTGSSTGSDSESSDREAEAGTASNVKTAETKNEAESEAEDSENELENENRGLDSVGELDFEIPEIETETKIEDSLVQRGSLNAVNSSETIQSGTGKIVRVKGVRNLKLLGIIPVQAPVSVDVNSTTGEELNVVNESDLIRLLSFLFTK